MLLSVRTSIRKECSEPVSDNTAQLLRGSSKQTPQTTTTDNYTVDTSQRRLELEGEEQQRQDDHQQHRPLSQQRGDPRTSAHSSSGVAAGMTPVLQCRQVFYCDEASKRETAETSSAVTKTTDREKSTTALILQPRPQ